MRAIVIAAAVVLLLAACGRGTSHPAAGVVASPRRGKVLIEYYGCGACHQIAGIPTAQGHVGPPLGLVPKLTTIAGVLPNTTANLVRWIMDPQRFVPKTDMPSLGIGRQGAQDIVAYLYGQ